MNPKINKVGAAVASMFDQKDVEEQAAQARAERAHLINQARETLTPEMVELIARDLMPECFVVDRAGYVAMAQLTLRAVQLVSHVADSVTATPQPKH